MIRLWTRIALVSLLSCLVGAPALAWQPIPVSGRVVDTDGATRSGLAVALERAPLPGVPTPEPVATTTDEWGVFHARVPEPGYWRAVLKPEPAGPAVTVTLPYQPVVEPTDWGDLTAGEPQLERGRFDRGGLIPGDGAAPIGDDTPPFRLRLVATETGRPIEGALVRVAPRNDLWGRSGPDGVVELPTFGGAPTSHLAIHAAGRMSTYPFLGKITSGGDLHLEPAGELSGHAVDESGDGLAGVRIGIELRSDAPMAHRPAVRTGPDGSFVLSLAGGTSVFHLVANHPARPPARHELARLEPGDRRSGLRLVVPVGIGVVGTVVDHHGRPVPGATVRLHRRLGGAPVRPSPTEQTTDRQGRFAAPALAQDTYDLAVTAAGHPEARRRGIELVAPPSGTPGETTAIDLGTLTLEAGARVVGQVTDPDDQLLEGVTVGWSQRRRLLDVSGLGTDPYQEIETDRDGRFEIIDLLAGASLQLTLRGEGHLPAQLTLLPTGPDDDAPLATDDDPLLVVLEPAASVIGRVETPDGSPVPSARVRAAPVRDLRVASRFLGSDTGTTDDDGRFELNRVPPGRVDVVAQAAGWAETRQTVIARADGDPQDLVLVLEAGATLTGRVVDADGRPLPWTSVDLLPPNPSGLGAGLGAGSGALVERTDDDGGFDFAGLAEGPHRVRVSHERYVPYEERLDIARGAPGTNRLDLQLTDRGASVAGRVSTADGQPVAAALVFVASVGRRWAPRMDNRTDASGAFVVQGLPAETVILNVQKDDVGVRREVDLSNGSVDGLEIALTGTGRIRGRIVGLGAERLVEVDVRVSGSAFHQPDVSPAGAFVVDDLGPGEWSVRASAIDGRSVSETVVIDRDGQEVAVELDLTPGEITVNGTVLVEGLPAGGLTVRLAFEAVDGGPSLSTQTDGSGRFRLSSIHPGRHQLSVLSSMGFLHQSEIDLVTSRDLVLDLDIATVSGAVTDPATGLGLEGLEVRLFRVQDLDRRTEHPSPPTAPGDRTDELGRFEIGPVAAGRYLVLVAGQDPAAAPVVDLSNGLDLAGLVVAPPEP